MPKSLVVKWQGSMLSENQIQSLVSRQGIQMAGPLHWVVNRLLPAAMMVSWSDNVLNDHDTQ